ncbi:MAG: replicative DNA helicase, partial [Planctomycetota bacterium]
IEKAGTIIYDAYHADEPVGDLLDKAERAIFDLAEHQTNEDAATLQELLEQTYERLANDDGLSDAGLKSGFYELDEMTNGLHAGEMIIIAARPSMGKTALMLNIAEHMSVETKQPVAVFSLEMSKDQLAQRLLCSRSNVDSQKVRRNTLTPDDFERLAMACGELGECPMYIDDTPGLSILQLRAKARRLAARHSIQAIFVDYLQLMADPSTRENRQQEVSSISRGIKALARELSVPVICLSQLNRSSESREGHRPRMSDLRESGSIEQDADVVMMVHREDYYHRGEDGYVDTNIAELIVAKQRNGPTGVVKLQFNGGTTRFNNLAAGAYGGV